MRISCRKAAFILIAAALVEPHQYSWAAGTSQGARYQQDISRNQGQSSLLKRHDGRPPPKHLQRRGRKKESGQGIGNDASEQQRQPLLSPSGTLNRTFKQRPGMGADALGQQQGTSQQLEAQSRTSSFESDLKRSYEILCKNHGKIPEKKFYDYLDTLEGSGLLEKAFPSRKLGCLPRKKGGSKAFIDSFENIFQGDAPRSRSPSYQLLMETIPEDRNGFPIPNGPLYVVSSTTVNPAMAWTSSSGMKGQGGPHIPAHSVLVGAVSVENGWADWRPRSFFVSRTDSNAGRCSLFEERDMKRHDGLSYTFHGILPRGVDLKKLTAYASEICPAAGRDFNVVTKMGDNQDALKEKKFKELLLEKTFGPSWKEDRFTRTMTKHRRFQQFKLLVKTLDQARALLGLVVLLGAPI